MVYTIYEPLQASIQDIQATSKDDITEIDLAIIGKEVLQGLHYIHHELGVVYGQLDTQNILLSYINCSIKLANIAAAILKPQQGDYAKDIAALGRVLISMKEPGTIARKPNTLQFEEPEDFSQLCIDFIQHTGTSSVSTLQY
ncbi:hypothetical protein BDV12DRAFT_191281 [Aspergillus spectabilis]